jgi:transposase
MNRKQELEFLATTNFFSLAKTEQHPRDRIRLLALGHVKNGTKKQSVAEMFQIHPITLRQWLRWFFHGGIAALKEGFRSGRKKKLPANQEAFFVQEVERHQETRKGGRIRAADLQVLLKEQFCVEYTTSWNDVDYHGFLRDQNIQNRTQSRKKTLKKIPGKSS